MEKEQILLLLMIIAVIVAGGLIIAAEKRRKKELKQVYEAIHPGDKYIRVYRSLCGPEETIIDTVTIVYKCCTTLGVYMVGYEYTDDTDAEPYESLLEDFLDNFERAE